MHIVRVRVCLAAVIVAAVAAGCNQAPASALESLLQARRLSADLLVQFTKAGDAGNRAVMADADETARAFVSQARQATQAVQKDSEALAPLLMYLQYPAESRLLDDFNTAFAEYRALDERILGLAVENTNLKAQRLAFGSASAAADAFSNALGQVTPLAANDNWHVKALAATAVAQVRQIQVLEAPHIAEADDAVMTRVETQMATAAAAARSAVQMLGTLVSSQSRQQLAAASAALDRFLALNGEIVTLSRRNSDVLSTALSLGQKGALTARGEAALHALQDALEQRELGGSR